MPIFDQMLIFLVGIFAGHVTETQELFIVTLQFIPR